MTDIMFFSSLLYFEGMQEHLMYCNPSWYTDATE